MALFFLAYRPTASCPKLSNDPITPGLLGYSSIQSLNRVHLNPTRYLQTLYAPLWSEAGWSSRRLRIDDLGGSTYLRLFYIGHT